jgi:putative ABC transport system substrate-binding protein
MIKKVYTFSAICILFAVLFTLYRHYSPSQVPSSPKKLVAITQIVPHPSLDKIREGILVKLREYGLTDDQIIFQNAQGNPSIALQVAQKFVSLAPTVIVPITTPSAQAAVSAAKSSSIPVIFSAVSDPVAAKLDDPGQVSDMVAGISDFFPTEKQVKLVQDVMGPGVKIGILYNAGESNSVALVNVFEKECTKLGLSLVKAAVSSTNDVANAARNLISRGIHAIFIPNDNTVVSALESVLRVTNTHQIPIFTGDPESVERGALGSVAFGQYEIGLDTGDMVVSFLKGEKIRDLGIKKPTKEILTLNPDVARNFGIEIPKSLLIQAHLVKTKI